MSKITEETVWWEFAEQCFPETNISDTTTLFISCDNNHYSGSIYKRRENNVGRMLHPILIFDYDNIKKKYPDYPNVKSELRKSTKKFRLEESKVYQADFIGGILNKCKKLKARPKLFQQLTTLTAKSIELTNWGVQSIAKQEFIDFAKEYKSDDFIKELRNGERYFVTEAIYINAFKVSYTSISQSIKNIDSIYNYNAEELKKSGVELLRTSDTNIILSIKKTETIYPFLVFAKINPKIGAKSLKDGSLSKPDFVRYNNLRILK